MDTERAETYLRLMAEAGLRRVLGPDPGSSWEYLARVRYVAAALAMLGAVDQKVADAITSNLETALALRSREHRGSLLPHRVRSGQLHLSPPAPGRLRASTRGASARLQAVLSGSLSPAAPAGKASHRKPAERGGPAQAMPVGRMFRLHGRDVDAEMWLLSLIRIPGRTLLAFSGRVNDGPAAGPAAGYFGQIGAVDDRGNSYSVEYSGSVGSGRTADGWLCLVPELPPATRWVELHGVLDKEAFLRVDVAGGATPARLAAEPTEPASPAERLLDTVAEGLLTRLPSPASMHESPDELVAALDAAGALPPGSPAVSRLAGLCQRAWPEAAPELVAALEAGRLAAVELPEPWTSVLAHFGRRHQPEVKPGIAPAAMALPELDGIRFLLAGLRSGPDYTQLTVVALGLPADGYRRPFGMPWTQWFPWWARDNAGRWHVADVDQYEAAGDQYATLRLRLVPPLPRSVTRLDLLVTGASARIQVKVPVDWVDGHD